MWFAKLEGLKLSRRKFPRDVGNRWNSTHNLLSFANFYRAAVDAMTLSQAELRSLSLSDHEWALLAQLEDLLQVR